jgi:hypothetical protein
MMHAKLSCSIVKLLLVGILMAGCAPHRLYRTNPELCTSSNPEQDCQAHFLQ